MIKENKNSFIILHYGFVAKLLHDSVRRIVNVVMLFKRSAREVWCSVAL